MEVPPEMGDEIFDWQPELFLGFNLEAFPEASRAQSFHPTSPLQRKRDTSWTPPTIDSPRDRQTTSALRHVPAAAGASERKRAGPN